MLTQDLIRSLFDYDPTTGRLTYRRGRRGLASSKIGQPAGVLQPNGYRLIMVARKRYYAHRLVWLWHNNNMPSTVKHVDGNRGNDCIWNLDSPNPASEFPEWMKIIVEKNDESI